MEKEEKPLQHIERNPILLFVSVLISVAIVFAGFRMLQAMNPWGFMVLVPGAVFSFQSLWWLLHPFALIFEDKVEIKQSLFHHKYRYFVDLKQVSTSKTGRLHIVYNDDEMEGLNLFGIKPAHVSLLQSEMEKAVSESMKARP